MNGMTSKPFRRSDRQRFGLRGNVKTCADEFSITEFAEDGKILFWQGNICGGPKSERQERQYFYDTSGRILSIQGGIGDHIDNFQYEHGRKIRVRTVPARPAARRGEHVPSVNVIFESTEEGRVLSEGGTVTTVFNDWDEPAESEVRDTEANVLAKIIHEYDSDGQLMREELIQHRSEFGLLKKLREAVYARIRKELQAHDLSMRGERLYVYNQQGRATEMHCQMGGYTQKTLFTYNDHGDPSESVLRASGGPAGLAVGRPKDLEFLHVYVYVYDQHGNWTEQTTSSRLGEDESFRNSSTYRRQLVYY